VSVVLASAAAGAYAAAMIGFHRWNVRRLRRVAGLSALDRLDWDALLQGLWPEGDDASARARRALLLGLRTENATDVGPRAEAAGFTGGERRWLEVLALSRFAPRRALEQLEQARAATAAEAYLREHLRLLHGANALNLEWVAFTSKRRLLGCIARFGDVPALYFARALASARVGMNRAALDDLGRAVYYSRQAPFYVQAVLDTPWIAEARPALLFQCRQAALSLEPSR
jgi:hypothetical protein